MIFLTILQIFIIQASFLSSMPSSVSSNTAHFLSHLVIEVTQEVSEVPYSDYFRVEVLTNTIQFCLVHLVALIPILFLVIISRRGRSENVSSSTMSKSKRPLS